MGEIQTTCFGSPDLPPVLAVHGFSHNGMAFRKLASALSEKFFFICPDMPGRGNSVWSTRPKDDYCFARFEGVVMALMAYFNIRKTRYIGTSMGGALGIRLAGRGGQELISHLVLNDVGPEIPDGTIPLILSEREVHPTHDNLRDMASHFADIYQRLANVTLSEADWIEFTRDHVRRRDDGIFTIHHDPAIYDQFAHHPDDFHIWPAFKTITAPVLTVWGLRSNILTREIIERMREVNPGMEILECPELGHVPWLNTSHEILAIERFFTKNEQGGSHE